MRGSFVTPRSECPTQCAYERCLFYSCLRRSYRKAVASLEVAQRLQCLVGLLSPHKRQYAQSCVNLSSVIFFVHESAPLHTPHAFPSLPRMQS